MKKISLWASQNRFPAIALVVLIKLLLAFIAFYIGSSLFDLGILIPFFVFLMALGVLIAAAFLYPSNKLRSSGRAYARQKSCDFTIAACSFIMIGTMVNNNTPLPAATVSLAANAVTSITPTAEEILASLQYRDKSTLTKKEKRILKEEFKRQLKVYVVAKLKKDNDGGAKAAKIILTIVVALGLLYLVSALACSLSCNGSDAAAIIVGIIGVAAIVWGTIAVIRRIVRGPRKKQPEPAVEN